MKELLMRGASLVLLAGSLWAMRRDGGAADAVPPPPASLPTTTAATATRRAGAPAYDVAIRLTDRLGQAHLDVPNLRAGEALFADHWRKLRTPWIALAGDAARLALTVALASGEEEEHVIPLPNGTVWVPDVRTWNMAEGSYDQREAIFAPTPATLGFRLAIPVDARLAFSTAIENPRGEGTVFAIDVVDASGATHSLFTRRATRAQAQQWVDANVDLSAYGGQEVELRLSTKAPDGPRAAPTTIALWGNPAVLAHEPTRVPYNVLWIVVDALRADVIPSFHDAADDAAARAAPHPPLEALLPRIDGLTPAIDALASRGVRFTHAWSAATWTRPGTLALLAGERSGEIGVDTTTWPLTDGEVAHYYSSAPPLLSLLLRRQGMVTRAFVNNYFMVGYAQIGLDMGFDRVDDQRYRTRDTAEITTRAVTWLKDHKDERFFVFCNYNSPHSPWDPPGRFLTRIPPPPAGPTGDVPRLYMGEAAKDDEAIGVLMKTLDDLSLRDRTLVMVTADHGETLSSAHGGTSALDNTPIRYHHTAAAFDETTHIPIVLSLPGVLPEGQAAKARVQSTDLAPTVLELEGLDRDAKMSGKSVLALARGGQEPDERVIVTEGRSMRAVLAGNWHLIVREGKAQTITQPDGTELTVPEELYDLSNDPGERINLAKAKPEVVAEMRARLEAALKGVAVAGSHAAVDPPAGGALPRLALRFAGAGEAHRVSGTVIVGDPSAKVEAKVVGAGPEAVRVNGNRVDLALTTTKDAAVGVDLRIDPPGVPVRWDLFLDDKPWPEPLVFAGPFGLAAPMLRGGLTSDEAREAAYAPVLPTVDPGRDLGLFVARERRAEEGAPARSSEGAAEMNQMLQDWGYARAGKGGKK